MAARAFGKSFVKGLIENPRDVVDSRKLELGIAGVSLESEIIFPHDLSSHYLMMDIHKFTHEASGREDTVYFKTIMLPIPTTLTENQGVTYNEVEMGALGGELSDIIAKMDIDRAASHVSTYFAGAYNLGKGLMSPEGRSEIRTQLENQQNVPLNAASMGLRKAQNPIGFGLNRFFGSAPNPHVTTMFRGVSLRSHNFTWVLAPQDADESDTLADLVQQLRQSMLPERATKNLTLSFPDQFHLRLGGMIDTKYFYQFKPAVLRQLSVNYVPNGTPGYFAGTGAPAGIQLSLDFLETVIHTRDDYGGTRHTRNKTHNPEDPILWPGDIR